MQFTHYLITRFNIKITDEGPETLDSAVANKDWLEERIKIFRAGCLPSVLGQRNRNFTWLIYTDPDAQLAELNEILNKGIDVEIIAASDYTSMLRDIIYRIRNAPTPFCITSRLDNDDMIHTDFIQVIQQHFLPNDKTIINLLSGFNYYSNCQLLTKWNFRSNNQFISIIEKTNADPLYTIYGFPHWRPPVEARMINIGDRPYWLYWRHEHNFSDQPLSGIPVFQRRALRFFSVPVKTIPVSIKNTIKYTLRWLPIVLKRRFFLLFKGEK